MPTKGLPSSYLLLSLLTLSIALAACGGGNTACTTPPCQIGGGAEFLIATSISGDVLSLPVDAKTGALGASTSAPGPAMSLGLAAVGSQFVYASDFQSGSIFAYSINSTSGALTAAAGSPFSLGPFSVPTGLATRPGSNHLYVADAGKIDGLTINTAGVPAAISGSPFLAGTNLELAVDPSGRFLYATDDDPPGGVSAFTIDSTTGALSTVPGSPFTISGQTVSNSQPFGLVVDSTGRFIYAALSTTNQIAAFSIVSGTGAGALTPVPGSPFPAGSTPLAVATAGNFLYANSADGTIWGYAIDSATGALNPVAGSPFPFHAALLTTDALGNFLYGSSSTGIAAFSIDSTTGALVPLAGSPFPAAGAVFLTIVKMPSQGG